MAHCAALCVPPSIYYMGVGGGRGAAAVGGKGLGTREVSLASKQTYNVSRFNNFMAADPIRAKGLGVRHSREFPLHFGFKIETSHYPQTAS